MAALVGVLWQTSVCTWVSSIYSKGFTLVSLMKPGRFPGRGTLPRADLNRQKLRILAANGTTDFEIQTPFPAQGKATILK